VKKIRQAQTDVEARCTAESDSALGGVNGFLGATTNFYGINKANLAGSHM